jgi:protein-tyrosine phosphatase
MAEALLTKMIGRDSKIKVASAGIQATPGLPASGMTLRVLQEEGVDFALFQSQRVTPKLIDDATYIFAMTHHHRDCLINSAPQHQEKIFLMTEWSGYEDISDPIGGTLHDYRDCCEAIQSCLLKIYAFIHGDYLKL